MAEAFYVGAYWGARAEPVADCACRLAGFLAALGEIDPLMAAWREKGADRKAASLRHVDPSPEALQELLLAGRARRDDRDRSVMPDLGFLVGMWNGSDVQVGLTVRCGASAPAGGISNSVVIQLPEAVGPGMALYRRDTALALMRAVVAGWKPAWCTWTNHAVRRAQAAQPGEIVVGWSTYLIPSGGEVLVDQLPGGVTAQRFEGDGLMVTLDGDADSAPDAMISAVRGALGKALRVTS